MKRLLLTLFLMTPFLAVAGLMYLLTLSLQSGTIVKQPAVGAGAGQTGGANALGEAIAAALRAKEDAAPKVVPTADEPKVTPAAPNAPTDAPSPAQDNPALVPAESLPQGFVIVVEDLAKLASVSSPIFIAGDFNGWNPADPKYKLEPQSDMKWRIAFDQPAEGKAILFKFTRGSWDDEELTDTLSAPPNRTLPKVDPAKLAKDEKPVFEFTVPKWGDMRPEVSARKGVDYYRPIQATGTVKRLQISGGGGPARGLSRDVLVWLPENYEQLTKDGRKLPVLYMQDGQNIFDLQGTIPAEWQADETATTLIKDRKAEPFIIVGIPHGGLHRIPEYLPGSVSLKVGDTTFTPGGDEYVDWLIREVLPKVQRHFAVETDPARVAIGGSSLGAAIALHAASRHPEKFGMVLLESLPLRTANPQAWTRWLDSIQTWPSKIYLGVGTKELADKPETDPANQGYADATKALAERLPPDLKAPSGNSPARLKLVVEPGATHTESAWAARLPAALQFLFPPAE